MRARKTTCEECPFRKDSMAGWLATYTPQELHNLVVSEHPFPCHMTHEEDVSFEKAAELPLCAGGLSYMRKNGKMPRNKEHYALMKDVDQETLNNTLGRTEFFEHHKGFKK